jgi:succinate-semialdehyde dehydrogenase/glutarate-semialdehyde dehydrogenase
VSETYPELSMFVDGEWRRGGECVPVINPADESMVGELPRATRSDLEAAVRSAERGFAIWRKTSPNQRCRILLEAAGLLRERTDKIAAAITREEGKPLAQARAEVGRACEILEWDANEGRRSYGRITPAEAGMMHMSLRQPIGVVAAFTPWNFPIASPMRKVAGALSAGCSIILKPSEETPAGAWYVAQALQDAGLPDGVLNLVYGDPAEISDFLVRQPAVRLVTLTGSVRVGKQLAALAGEYMKPAIMELGGHGPVIVCDDADPEDAAAKAVVAKSMNAGQVCVAPTRFYVAASLSERFANRFAELASSIRIGDGMDPATGMGPLANERRLEVIHAMVTEAVQKGARLMCGGNRVGNNGYYYPLTVLADVPEDARIMNEEPFGPVALINPVNGLDEALSRANRLPFGLAAYAFTALAANAARLGEEIESGTMAINHFGASVPETPFGGVKESGYGREGGAESLDAFTVVKHVAHLTR